MLTRRAFAGTLAALPLAARAQAEPMPVPLPVIASFSILADFAVRVGGARVSVASLAGPDADMHAFEPAPADGARLKAARVVVVNGLGLEGWLDRFVKASGSRAAIVTASRDVKPRREEAALDPHAWLSAANARLYVAAIRDGFTGADPDGRTAYEESARAYLAELDALDAELRATLGAIPPARRKIVSTHDAFGYFADAYGLRFIAPRGLAPEAEVAAKDVAKIVRQIRADKAPAVFLENVSDPRLMETIARETGAKIGGKLYSDALSPPGGAAPDYVSLMRHNAKTLTAALAG